jgi:hypothetical protein
MKKTLLSLLLLGGAQLATAQQTSVQVLSPAHLVQGFDHSMASWGATPDMTNPANRVIAPIMIARSTSGTEGDSLMCNPTTMDLTGKIAIVYRGSCEFGLKAKNAWDAGAAAVVVVNNVPADLVSMAAGANGDVVTVPVVSITKEAGAILHQALGDGETVDMLIGNKIGYYQNDLGTVPGYTANVPAQVPVELAPNTAKFPIKFAAQIYNYGASTQTNVRVDATIKKDGNVFYQTSSNVIPSFASGDSTDQFTFADYNGNLGIGDYEIIYEIVSDATDDAPTDNTMSYTFRVNGDKRFAFAKYDYTNNETFNSGNYAPSTREGVFKSCIVFRNADAHTLGVKGIHFVSSIKDDQSMVGQEILVEVFKWADNFQFGVASPTFNAVTPVTDYMYTYEDELANEFVFSPVNEYVLLEDNVKYLACVGTYHPDVYLGYDNETKYDYYSTLASTYISPILNKDTWYAGGFQGGPVPSLTIEFFTDEELSVMNAKKLTGAMIFPNPATDKVNIKVDNFAGAAQLIVTDLVGKTVIAENVTINENGLVSFDSSALTTGMYMVNMKLANGSTVKASVSIK